MNVVSSGHAVRKNTPHCMTGSAQRQWRLHESVYSSPSVTSVSSAACAQNCVYAIHIYARHSIQCQSLPYIVHDIYSDLTWNVNHFLPPFQRVFTDPV